MGTMAKRLNRLLAAIAAAATLATGVAGSAWADTADGKVDFDVKAADGTTLDGMDVGLYKVGDWNMDALERGSDGALTGIHATSADTDDRSGFTVAQDGSQSAVEPHGRAAKAAESAGIAVSDGTDPLDAAWALDPSDSRVKAFAQAYARELSDASIAAGATAKGGQLDPARSGRVCRRMRLRFRDGCAGGHRDGRRKRRQGPRRHGVRDADGHGCEIQGDIRAEPVG